MATIRLVSTGDGDEAAAALEKVVSRRGREASFYRMYANSPNLLDPICEVVWALWSAHEVDRGTLELTILRVSQLVGAEYEWTHHRGMAADAGVTEEQITALIDWEAADCFDDRQRALLAIVDAAVTSERVPSELIAAAQRHFTDAQMVDLMTTIGLYRSIGQMLLAFDVDFEDWAPRDRAEWQEMMSGFTGPRR